MVRPLEWPKYSYILNKSPSIIKKVNFQLYLLYHEGVATLDS